MEVAVILVKQSLRYRATRVPIYQGYPPGVTRSVTPMPHCGDLEYRLRFSDEMVRLGELPGADRLIQTNAFQGLAYAVWDAGEFERAAGLNRAAARASLETGIQSIAVSPCCNAPPSQGVGMKPFVPRLSSAPATGTSRCRRRRSWREITDS